MDRVLNHNMFQIQKVFLLINQNFTQTNFIIFMKSSSRTKVLPIMSAADPNWLLTIGSASPANGVRPIRIQPGRKNKRSMSVTLIQQKMALVHCMFFIFS